VDFATITAEGLLAALPPDEDDRWELKSAAYLESQKRNELKKELGKQVSAFSNSGGGHLVFGVSNDKKLEPCPTVVGRQPMKDYLSTMVEQSVEHPTRHYRVHAVPFRDDPTKAVYVIEVQDSPAAPHQAKDERAYYYRIDGHSKPAPHFHLELLRNRFTKAVLRITEIDYVLQTAAFSTGSNGEWRMGFAVNVTVENTSLQAATGWGVQLKLINEDFRWRIKVRNDSRTAHEGACVRGDTADLLPGETAIVTAFLHAGQPYQDRFSREGGFISMWENFPMVVRAASQNYVSEETYFGWRNPIEEVRWGYRFEQEYKKFMNW